MAKQIKVIQCPQCGSTQQSLIKEDYYRCGSCGAEYFLDNDDINVNINHKSPNLKYILIGLAVFLGSIFIISTIFRPTARTTPRMVPRMVASEAPKKKEYKEQIFFYTLDKSGSPVMFYLTKRRHEREDGDKDGTYIVFYNYIENKILKEENLDDENNRDFKFNHAYLPAINKDIVIVNERKIYELNFSNLSFKDISVELLTDYPEFSSGIASAKFIHVPRGEGFILLSNMGKEFYFVPSFKKLYTHEDFFDIAAGGMKKLSPNAINKTYYTFSTKSDDYPDEMIELLKIVYKYNNGGPEDKESYPRWRKQYPYSGLIYDNTPFKKIIVDKDRSRIVSYDNITPGRIYFSPTVLSQEKEDRLLISFKPTISPEEKTQIQLLDLNTKEPIWTVTTAERLDGKNTVKIGKYYILPLSSNKFLKISDDDGTNEIINLITQREYNTKGI